MLDLSKDENCVNVEKALVEYAESVANREQARRDFFAAGGKAYDLKNDARFSSIQAMSSLKKNVFYVRLKKYIEKFEKNDDKKQVNGHFLWGVVRLYKDGLWRKNQLFGNSKDFLNEGLDFIENVVCNHPMTSLDKVRLLQHLIANGYHKEVNSDKTKRVKKETLNVLASFDPHDLEQTVWDELYDKAVCNIEKKRKDKHSGSEVETFFSMFNLYVENVKLVHKTAVADYANLYFLMADKVPNELDVGILARLASKTMKAKRTARACNEKFVLDKDAMKDVFAAYVQHVDESKGFNDSLANQMKRLAMVAFEMTDYSTRDVNDILDILDNLKIEKRGGKAKLLGLEKLRTEIANTARGNRNIMLNPLGRNDGNYSYYDMIDYAGDLFERAKKSAVKPVKIDTLWGLVENEGENRKALVRDIAEIYANSRRAGEMEYYGNMEFHERMTKFFQTAVSEFEYDDRDVASLERTIRKGAGGHESFVNMAFYVKNSVVVPDNDWRKQIADAKIGRAHV